MATFWYILWWQPSIPWKALQCINYTPCRCPLLATLWQISGWTLRTAHMPLCMWTPNCLQPSWLCVVQQQKHSSSFCLQCFDITWWKQIQPPGRKISMMIRPRDSVYRCTFERLCINILSFFFFFSMKCFSNEWWLHIHAYVMYRCACAGVWIYFWIS